MILDPIKASLAPYALAIKAGLGVVLFLVVFIGGCNHGAGKWEGKYDTEAAAHKATKAEHAGVLRRLADQTKAAAEKAKAASAAAKAARAANNKLFEEQKRASDTEIAGLRRALRNGAVQLRKEWTCPAARSAEGEAGTPAGGQDGEAELRRAREGSILEAIGDADHADRWVGWLQTELISTRKACGAVP